MDEKPDQIIGHIEAQRDQLGRNLNELETRVRENADWRTWFDRNPMMVMGAALGGGLLLGSMVGGRTSGIRHRRRSRSESYRQRGDIMGSSGMGRSSTSSSSTGSRAGSSSTGAAFTGAATAGVISSESHRSEHPYGGSHTSTGGSHTSSEGRLKSAVSSLKESESWHQVSETMDDIKCALVGFGIVKAKEFLNHAIPGFDQHLDDAQQRRQGRSSAGEHSSAGTPESHSGDSRSTTTSGKEENKRQQPDPKESGHHLYTPAGEQISRSGSYSSDPVGTYRP